MLHVFNVNRGEMLTFDVNLAMDRVLELKNAISSSHNIHSDKQVMLISGGQALCDDERVCTYAAGTETNPVYLFDKASIEKENAQLCKAYPQNDDFGESIASALALNPSYQTVVSRTKLAILLHEATKRHVATTKSLVHDEHLMHQGWQAAVANLLDTVSGFKERVEVMWTKCSKLLQKSSNYDEALNGIDSVLDILKKIPVFSAILNNSKESVKSSDSAVCRKETMDTNECKDAGMNLLEWIEIKCKNVSVRQILHECKQKISYLSKDKLMTLLGECDKAQHQSMNSRMREISGINERLAALDHLIISGEQQVKEQTGIAQGFVRNQETARDLHNTSSSIDALFTLCESHVTQLRIMRDYEISARDSLRKSLHAKNELAANLHTRLRWLYFIQRGILNADVKLSMFTQQLYQLQQQVEFLSQIKLCPSLYLSSVTEIVRRRCFANSYIQWTNKAVSDARVARDREIVKRKTFQSNITGHFLQKMFHGFSDKPPTFIRKAMRPFDTDLPDVTVDHLSHLSNLLPTFKEILKLPSCKDLSPLSEIFRNKQVLISTAQTTTTSLTLASLSDGSASYPAVTDRGIHPMSTSDKQSGSFTVVDSANVTNDDAQTTLASTRPGGFVVTSLENVTEENLQKNFKSFSRTSPASTTMEGGLPKASFSEPVFSPLPATPATQANSIDATLSEISDIIGPDSPPDSEFFSIQQFHRLADSPNTLRKPLKNIAEADIDGSKPSLSDAEVSATYKVPSVGSSESMSQYSEKQNLSTVFVGSPGSNSSTSYQKVDGISSDEEMFHSVTSDQGKDVKSLKKKLSQLQTEYDTLLNESKQEKEELNTLVRKLQNEITSLEENQGRLESEYDRRWNESKSELDNVIIQLENERIERKKAWNEGSNLEKQLKELTDERDRCKTDMEQFQEQIRQREEMIKHLEASLEEEKNSVTSTLADEQEYHEQRLLQLRTKHEQELQSLKSSSSRFERDLSLVQTELSAADDRIQELETALSDHERLLEENNIQILELQTKMSSLTDEIATSKDSLDKKEQEINVCRQQADETNMKLLKANEQILCLKSILADYETKLNDDRSKENLIKNLKASLRQTELEKNELDCELKSVKQQIIFLQKDVSEKQKELVRMEEMADRDAEIHKEEIEKINLSHSDELQSLLNEKEELLESIKKEYVDAMASVKAELEQQIKTKEEEWLAREKDFELHHRNEVDELEADRLVSVAAAQQSIEELRTKYKETSRLHENEQKELLEKQSQLKKEYQDLKEKSKSVNDKNEKIKKEKNQLEAELQECRNLIRDLEQKCKQNSAIIGQMSLLSSSMLTSSTDEEMESKRTKMDSDSGQGDEMSQSTMEAEAVAENVMTVSMADHKKTIHVLRKNFEHDKKVMQELFKKREEEAARRRQMVFNSAIKRATASKDQELQRLKDVLASKSTIDPLLTQSAFTPPTEPMVTLSNPNSLPSQMSMSVSVASSPPPDLPQTSQKNDSRPVLDNREKDKVTVTNFQVGDTVLVCYNETYQHYTLLTTSRTLHFVHNISLEKLGISSAAGSDSKRSMTFATLVEKEYCQARKAQNRFHVPISTKFYRVKLAPIGKKDP